VLARLAGLARDPRSGVAAAKAAEFTDQYVVALRDVIGADWDWPNELKEQDFDALRGRDNFKKLLAELEAKSGSKDKPQNRSPRAATLR
jgi:hypothetical protein